MCGANRSLVGRDLRGLPVGAENGGSASAPGRAGFGAGRSSILAARRSVAWVAPCRWWSARRCDRRRPGHAGVAAGRRRGRGPCSAGGVSSPPAAPWLRYLPMRYSSAGFLTTGKRKAKSSGPGSRVPAPGRKGSWLLRGLGLRPGQRVGDVVPELLPRLPFGLGELGKGLRPAHVGEIRVYQPVPQRSSELGLRWGIVRLLVQKSAPSFQVGPQPVQGLPAQAGAFLVVELVGVLALAGRGEGRGAGGGVAVGGQALAGGCRRAGEGFLVEAGGGAVEAFEGTQAGQFDPLGGAGWGGFAVEEVGQLF